MPDQIQEAEPVSRIVEADGAARQAGLRYVNDAMPGIRRRRAGKGFAYRGTDGRTVDDPQLLQRIRSLAIPPAWRDVWICPSPNGHLQATGRDAKGRKQYRYHPRWRHVRDETKYEHMSAFGRALPVIRARIERDLQRYGLPREKVLAAVVRLLETTLVRVGNREYARDNASFGLTTLCNRHVSIDGDRIDFEFHAKSGRLWKLTLKNRKMARLVARCRDLPGHDLFQYLDEQGNRHGIGSEDVNAYLKEAAGEDFTAKDFRTWAGTVLASTALVEAGPFTSESAARRNIAQAVEKVARRLGNTSAVCRKSYVHPCLLETYLEGTLATALAEAAKNATTAGADSLSADEQALLAFIEKRSGGVAAKGKAR